MKTKLFVLTVAVCLLLCACGGQKLDSLQIQTAEDLFKLNQCPSGQVELLADIDLQGTTWTPVDFNGTFVGNGHTISNFTIDSATKDGNQGFFGLLGANASVTELTLADVTVTGSAEASAVGVLAGKNQGQIKTCNVGVDAPYEMCANGSRWVITGEGDDSSLTDSRSSGVSIGAVAGINDGSIKEVLSYVKLYTDPAANAGLVGGGSGSADGQWRDISAQPGTMSETETAMRQTIVERMEAQANIEWIPSKDMTFTTAYSNGTDVVFQAGVKQYGLPYTQKYGSLERMLYCLNEDGTVQDWLPAFSDAADPDKEDTEQGWDLYIGNDCSGGVYWAWNRVCASIAFMVTQHMVPTMDNQSTYGTLPVGNYSAASHKTQEVVSANGSLVILEAYTHLRKADAVVTYGNGGHTRLVADAPMVMRNADGSLNINYSYIVTHEQGVGIGTSGKSSSWLLNGRYPFALLLKDYYIPITTMELQMGEPAAPMPQAMGITGPVTGRIMSNYRIVSTTVTLKNKQTGKVTEDMRFTALHSAVTHENAAVVDDAPARTTVRLVDLQDHKEVLDNLESGSYEYTVSALLSNGQSYEIQTGEYTH